MRRSRHSLQLTGKAWPGGQPQAALSNLGFGGVQGVGIGEVIARSVRTVNASVQPSGAMDDCRPLSSTFSGSAPSEVRWPASQAIQEVASAVRPDEAAARANIAVSGVQASLWLPRQISLGSTPPFGSFSRDSAFC